MIEKDDNILVSEVLEGRVESFRMLVYRYQNPLYRYLVKAVKDCDAAKDLLQNVFIKAYENLYKFNPAFRFFSWIYRIAVNESINYIKRQEKFSVLPDKEAVSSETDPGNLLEKKEILRELEDALNLINNDYKTLIILKHYQGLSYTEICEVTGLTEKKVKSRLYMARQALKELLLNKIEV